MMTFSIMYNPFSCVFYDEQMRAAVMAAPTMNDALYNNVLTASAIFLAMYGLFMV